MPADPAASPDPASAPTAEHRVSESRFRARSYELDAFSHVNHAVFLNWLEQARFEALEAGGFTMDGLAERGWAVVVVRVEIDYRAEVRLHDEVVVRTRVDETRNTSMVLDQRVVRLGSEGGGEGGGGVDRGGGGGGGEDDQVGETLAAEARVVAVWLKKGRPARIPTGVLEALGAPGGGRA